MLKLVPAGWTMFCETVGAFVILAGAQFVGLEPGAAPVISNSIRNLRTHFLHRLNKCCVVFNAQNI